MALSDGATIWAFRYSTQGRSRSLFHSQEIDTLREMYPDVERLNLFGQPRPLWSCPNPTTTSPVRSSRSPSRPSPSWARADTRTNPLLADAA
jgi:glutamine amidotransferase